MIKNEIIIKYLKIDEVSKFPIEEIKKMMPTRFEMALKHKDETSKLLSFASIILMSKNMEFKEEDIFYNEYKKPMLKDIYFNLSHSGDYAIFVKDKLPIGVDIQIINKNNLDIKKNAFTKN